MSRIRIGAFAAALASAASMPVLAQPASPPAGATDTPPGKTAPGTAPSTNLDGKPGSLSTKLGEANGVIKPSRDVDPAISKPSPQSGTMPVIRPGETGGGVAK